MKKLSLVISFLIVIFFGFGSFGQTNTDKVFIEIAEELNPSLVAIRVTLTPRPEPAEKQEIFKEDPFKKEVPDSPQKYEWLPKNSSEKDKSSDKNQSDKNQSLESMRKKLLQLQEDSRQNNKGPAKDKSKDSYGDDGFYERYRKSRKEIRDLGTGILIDEKGLVLSATPGNIGSDAGRYEISFQIIVANESFPAKLISSENELAFWQIENPENISSKPLAFAKDAKPGQIVSIIGKDEEGVFIKMGHINRKRKNLYYIDSYGWECNTEGALVINLEKEIIGIVIYGYTTIKAIPVNQGLIAKLMNSSKRQALQKEKSWIGIELVQLDKEGIRYLEDLGLTIRQEKGIIARHYPLRGSPAERAGLEKGDIIKSINGKITDELETAGKLIEQTPPGQTLTLEIIEEKTGRPRTVKIKTSKKESYHHFLKGEHWEYSGKIY